MVEQIIDRRGFLKTAGLVAGSAAIGSSPVLSSLARAAETSRTNPKSAQLDEIVSLIDNGLRETEWGRDSKGYRRAYEDYSRAIDIATKSTEGTNWDETQPYKELKIVALMWQAYLLNHQAGNNIVSREKIQVRGLPQIEARLRVNDANVMYNRLKALQNYEIVEGMLQEAKEKGKEFRYSVNQPKLGERGNIARLDLVYKRMNQTIDALIDISPREYIEPLRAKKSEVSKKLEAYRRSVG